MEVEERPISVDELFEAHASGKLTEAFGTGTAAVISPVGLLEYRGKEMVLSQGQIGPIAQDIYDTLTGIQRGERPDPYGWIEKLS